MMLELDKVSRHFYQGQNKIDVLKDLELSIQEGQSVSILGESGSGKSTLLGLLAGLDHPDTGTIRFSQQVISDFNESQMAKFRGENIGIVFQQYHLMGHLTALENVMLPLQILERDQVLEKSEAALESVGLAHRLDHLPSQLSGGECQRVALARAIVHRPKLVLADEPSGNLDVKTGDKVMNMMFEIISANKLTLVLVTHSLELARKCQVTYQLYNGALHVQ